MHQTEEMPNKLDPRFQQQKGADLDLLEKGAILQRDRETYAIAPHLPGGIISPDQMIKLAQVAKAYNCQAIKVTDSQRIALVGLKKDDIDKVWAELGMKPGAAIGLCVRSIKFCPGSTFCRVGVQDAISMGQKLDEIYHGMTTPGKFKISVSGCINKCTEPLTRDIGLVGMPKGWNIYLGGNGGRKPRLGELFFENIETNEALNIIERAVDIFKKHAKSNDRMGDVIDRLGKVEITQQLTYVH